MITPSHFGTQPRNAEGISCLDIQVHTCYLYSYNNVTTNYYLSNFYLECVEMKKLSYICYQI